MNSLKLHTFEHAHFAQDFLKMMSGTSELQTKPALKNIHLFQLVSPTDFIQENFQASLTQGGFANSSPPSFEQNQTDAIQANLQNQIYTLDAQTQKEWNDLNANLNQQGKPSVNYQQTMKTIEEIMNDPSLSEKEKGKRINDLAKKLGLSKKQMKKFFTQRLAKIYQEAASKINLLISQAKASLTQAENLYGKQSTQALQAQEKLNSLSSRLEPLKQKFEAKAQSYSKLFPSFWSKFTGVVTKIGKIFSKIMDAITPLLSFIPGIGQAISIGWNFTKGLFQAIKGNISGALQQLISGVSSLIPGGGILSKISPIFSKISSFASKVLPFLSKIAPSIPKIGPIFSKITQTVGGLFKTETSNTESSPPLTLSI